jgi:hypothetical protein
MTRQLKKLLYSLLAATLPCTPLLLTGCPGDPAVTSQSVTPAAPPAVKQMLEGVAQSGELGSGAQSIREELEKLKASDASKAEGLLKDLDALEKLTDPNQIKSSAKAMADKL